MSRTRRILCIFYGLIALTALWTIWGQMIPYFVGKQASSNPLQYLYDLKVNAAARSFAVDIDFFLLAGAGLMVVEARKLGVRFVWLYVIFGFIIAIGVTFPLFLIARELRLAKMENVAASVELTLSDVIGLALTTLLVLAINVFILT